MNIKKWVFNIQETTFRYFEYSIVFTPHVNPFYPNNITAFFQNQFTNHFS